MEHERPLIRAKAHLLRRIEKNYEIRTDVWRIGTLELPFVRIADPDRVLDQVAEQEDRLERLSGHRADGERLHLPYWAELWDSALGIGQILVRQQQAGVIRKALEVMDLGCGMGLAGTVAARLGMRVLFADLEPPALLFARLNSLPNAASIRTRQLDWQRDRLAEQFDIIIGADILYERKQWDFLEPFWRAHLAAGGVVMLGEPGRQTGDLFIDWITARKWSLQQHLEPVSTRPTPIRIFELRLP